MLNKQTKIDTYPVPWIDETLDYLCKAQVSLKIDVTKAYHQVFVEPAHMHKTAFFMKYGLFEFLVLPFRLVNAPAMF